MKDLSARFEDGLWPAKRAASVTAQQARPGTPDQRWRRGCATSQGPSSKRLKLGPVPSGATNRAMQAGATTQSSHVEWSGNAASRQCAAPRLFPHARERAPQSGSGEARASKKAGAARVSPRQGEAQPAQAQAELTRSLGHGLRSAEQAGGWGLPVSCNASASRPNQRS